MKLEKAKKTKFKKSKYPHKRSEGLTHRCNGAAGLQTRRCKGRRVAIKGTKYRMVACRWNATQTRDDWRWGRKDEQPIVLVTVPLCDECAKWWDDVKAEGAAEAAGS